MEAVSGLSGATHSIQRRTSKAQRLSEKDLYERGVFYEKNRSRKSSIRPSQIFVKRKRPHPDALHAEREKGKKRRRIVGVFSGGDPPLPIPNRVVKPASADGTAVDAAGE